MNALLEDILNVEISMGDTLIHSDSEQTLKDTTSKVVGILKEAANGIDADGEKIEAIKKLKAPKNKKQLLRFLGMVTYLAKFIENLSEVTDPLRKLLRKDTEWEWSSDQQSSFEKLKEKLSSAPVLRYYDVNGDLTLSVDASSTAIGAVLLQAGQPIGYASMAFSPAQRNYPQIEKEATAIKFDCKTFHQYVYGKALKVKTDLNQWK